MAFWRRRLDYARSIGLLARRHPDALTAVHIEPWSATIVALVLLRRPGLAATTAAGRWRSIRRLIATQTDKPGALAASFLARSLTGTAHGFGHAIRRTWSPALIAVSVCYPRSLALLAVAEAAHAAEHARQRPGHIPLLIADDLVAAAGTCLGCVDARTIRPLLPARADGRRMAHRPPEVG
jgi:mycofactocin glycosyltransferase